MMNHNTIFGINCDVVISQKVWRNMLKKFSDIKCFLNMFQIWSIFICFHNTMTNIVQNLTM